VLCFDRYPWLGSEEYHTPLDPAKPGIKNTVRYEQDMRSGRVCEVTLSQGFLW
jgi:hypothetical protein